MNEPKFSKGPWTVDPLHRLLDADGQQVLLADSRLAFATSHRHPERLANTALVEAAPDMFEALQSAATELYDICHSSGDPNDESNMQISAIVYREIRNALKKANP